MSQLALSVGQKIELNDSRIGIIRFVGSTAFQTGEWIGVELDEPSGKNDGSVQGKRYFECPAGYGIFCRASGISQVLDDAKPKTKPTNGVAVKGRPSSIQGPPNGARRQTLQQQDGPGRRASTIQSTPTPTGRTVSGIRSPVKSPTKQSATNGTSSSSTSRTATPSASTTVVGKRPVAGSVAPRPSRSSLAPAPSATASRRTSTLPSAPGTASRGTARQPPAGAAAARAPASRTAAGNNVIARSAATARSSLKQRLSSAKLEATGDDGTEVSEILSSRESAASETQSQDEGQDDEDDTTLPNFAPRPVPAIPQDPPDRPGRQRRPSSPAASIHSQRTIRSSAATTRQIEELEAKIRVLERKRTEDREVKHNLEKAEQERDQYKGIIEKLQNKYRPQQQELDNLKRELAECHKQVSDVEDLKARHELELESAWVDREYAEEQADGYKADLEILRSKNEEMELELEILKEENIELSKEMSPEERTSAGWLQLEKSNERLKEALISLRDITQDKETELKEQVDGLEDQLKETEAMKAHFEETRQQLWRSQADTEDLRQQLEVAQGAEDMIERLSEQNDALRNKMSDLRATIDDLEAIRELNDELEITHVENEKQLQEEIDFKDSLLLDRERTAKEQQAALDQAEYNISRFRELVTQLQGDLQDLEASKQISESEAAQLSNKSRAMMDLNHRLQTSAAKTQVKTIDLELRKLEAEEASEHLAIVQLFLPETFQAERDSVLALLRFKRIGFKANLVQTFVKERIASFGTRGEDEEVFAACDAVDKLAWIAGMADRLVNSISSCNADAFAQYGGALYELEVVERTLDGYVEALRRDELKEGDMAVRLGRSMDVMSHLSSLHRHNGVTDHADDFIMRTMLLQSRMDSATSALALARTLIERHFSNIREEDAEDEDENVSDTALILNRLKSLIEHARTAKVVSGKTLRALSDLRARSLTLEEPFIDHFDNAESVASEITAFASQSGSSLQELFTEEGRTEPLSPSEVASTLSRVASSVFSLPTSEAGPYAALDRRLRDLGTLLQELSSLPMDLDNTIEFERSPAPWIARADELKKTKIASIDTEAELSRALETVRERDNALLEKETALDEQGVKIEMLEARMSDAKKRTVKIAELERSLREAKDSENKARQELAQARREAQHDVDRVREEMARFADERQSTGNSKDLDGNAMGASVRITLKRAEQKIAGLEGAVRYLKEDNHRLRIPALDAPRAVKASIDWLHDPLQVLTKRKTLRNNQEAVHREGERLLEQMLTLATAPPSVDLTKMPENKLGWRPIKEHSRWKVEQRNEEWVDWKQWRSSVVKQGLSVKR